MAEAVGALRVDLSANAAQFGRDLEAARGHLSSTGASFQRIGGVAGAAGDKIAQGLKRNVNDFRELGNAVGLAGGEVSKFSAQLADMALTGFSPMAAGIAALGLAIGGYAAKVREAEKASQGFVDAAAETSAALTRHLREFADFKNGTQLAGIQELEDKVDAAKAALAKLGGQTFSTTAEVNRFLDAAWSSATMTNDVYFATVSLKNALSELELATKRVSIEEQRRQRAKLLAAVAADDAKREAQNAAAVRDSVKAAKDLEEETRRLAAAQADQQATADAAAAQQLEGRLGAIRASRDAMDAYREERDLQVKTLTEVGTAAAAAKKELADLNKEREASAYGPAAGKRQDDRIQELLAQSQVDWQERFNDTNFSAGFAEQMRKNEEAAQEFGRVGMAVADRVTDGLSSDVAGALTSVVNGTKSAKQAFSELAASVVTDLTFMVFKALAFQAIMAALGGGGTPTLASAFGSAGGPSGGAKSALKSSQSDGGLVIEMHDHAGVRKSAQVTSDPDGRRRLKVMIAEAAADDVMSGGPLAQAIASAHGTPRVATRRRG